MLTEHLIFYSFSVTPFDLYATVLEMRACPSIFYQYRAEGLIWKQRNRCMYFCRPVWHPHWCYVHVASWQGHTQTHTGTQAAGEPCLRCLLLPPDGLHHRATGLFLPCFLCPPPPQCRGHWVKPVVFQSDSYCAASHPPGHLLEMMRKFHRLLPLIPKKDLNTLTLLVLAGDCWKECH